LAYRLRKNHQIRKTNHGGDTMIVPPPPGRPLGARDQSNRYSCSVVRVSMPLPVMPYGPYSTYRSQDVYRIGAPGSIRLGIGAGQADYRDKAKNYDFKADGTEPYRDGDLRLSQES